MTLRTILYGTAAAATLALASPLVSPISLNPIAPVQAAASVSFSVFYDDLAPYGDWVSYQDGYVFVPADTGPDWRPYTVGRWVWTDDYGWTWVSEEDHGWATHHYGRWAYADDIGWYWVPGSRWAPAWVSWRRSDDHVVWAPLPPDGDDPDLAFSISIGTIPDYYWVAVPTRSFLDINLSLAILDDDDDRRRIVREARREDRVRARNDRMMNIAFDPEYIEERTGEKVERREVRRSERRGRENVNDDSVTVFNDEIRPDRDRKPAKVKQVKEVRRSGVSGEEVPEESVDKRKKKPVLGEDQQPPEQADGPPEDAPDQTATTKRKKKPVVGEDQQPPEQADGPPEDAPDQTATSKRKKKPVEELTAGEEQPAVQKQRRKKPVLVEDGGNEGAEEQIGTAKKQRRAKPAQQASEEPMEQGAPAKAERKRQAAEKPAQRRKAKACDPSVNPDCPAQ